MRLASYVPGELIPCPFVWLNPGITPCCKTRRLFSAGADLSIGELEAFSRNRAEPAASRQVHLSPAAVGPGPLCGVDDDLSGVCANDATESVH